MSNNEFLIGKLLVSQPKIQEGHFSKSVILVAQHNSSGAWGVIMNHAAKTVTMSNIMSAVGIDYDRDDSIYVGGPVEPTRAHIVHSLDWSSNTTLRVTKNIGITGDLSILSAIAAGEGPKMYRAGVGLSVWSAGQLEGEQSGIEPWTQNHRWLITDASLDLCLNGTGDEQWQRAINKCVSQRVSELF